jgi:hypothetical protein
LPELVKICEDCCPFIVCFKFQFWVTPIQATIRRTPTPGLGFSAGDFVDYFGWFLEIEGQAVQAV